ncbi:MAG TPA: Flp family type IVb pilin [Noviherbaspirillum sp.]|nr:Flp family type IVb pilin [Noviherbaspirillum sp.]
MNVTLQTLGNAIRTFFKDEDGAQVVEYALIIAVVSIALVIALQALTADGGGFATFIGRVTTCLTTATCT